jgi:hypothetical protein
MRAAWVPLPVYCSCGLSHALERLCLQPLQEQLTNEFLRYLLSLESKKQVQEKLFRQCLPTCAIKLRDQSSGSVSPLSALIASAISQRV